ncbi:MAG: hypothetical protein L7F77_15900 [Candidatus Magnetominusculus sp. LBB02]|nr:hypothetical protein [Candidatus Magnetominusculus sp. LBB02]
MDRIEEIENRRKGVLSEMDGIRSMKRGTINKQYLKVPVKGADEPKVRGPYYVLSRREGSLTVSERLTNAEQLEQARRDIAAHHKFTDLCKEYEVLTEKLGVLERNGNVKKNDGNHLREKLR